MTHAHQLLAEMILRLLDRLLAALGRITDRSRGFSSRDLNWDRSA